MNTPRLRGSHVPFDSRLRLAVIDVIHKSSDQKGLFESCISCKAFNEPTERCLKYNAKPPARIIAFGCPSYEDVDDIPF